MDQLVGGCVCLATAGKQEGGVERNDTNLQARSNLKGAVTHMLKGRKFLSQVSFLQTTRQQGRKGNKNGLIITFLSE